MGKSMKNTNNSKGLILEDNNKPMLILVEKIFQIFSPLCSEIKSVVDELKQNIEGKIFKPSLQIDIKEAYTTHKKEFTVNGKSIRITIPAGIEDQQTIKISGYGSPGINNGPNGDLYITFSISNTSLFKRVGNDLFLTHDLDLYAAVLGGDVTITDFNHAKLKLKVAAGTQNGTKVRLKGKGFPVYKKEGQFGDLYITYNVVIPKNLSEKEIELFNQLSNLVNK